MRCLACCSLMWCSCFVKFIYLQLPNNRFSFICLYKQSYYIASSAQTRFISCELQFLWKLTDKLERQCQMLPPNCIVQLLHILPHSYDKTFLSKLSDINVLKLEIFGTSSLWTTEKSCSHAIKNTYWVLMCPSCTSHWSQHWMKQSKNPVFINIDQNTAVLWSS